MLGHDYGELMEEVKNSDVHFSLGIIDRYDLFRCGVLSMLEGVVFKEKFRQYRKEDGKFFIFD